MCLSPPDLQEKGTTILGKNNWDFRQSDMFLCEVPKFLLYLDTQAGKQGQCLKPSAHGNTRVPSTAGGLYIKCSPLTRIPSQ